MASVPQISLFDGHSGADIGSSLDRVETLLLGEVATMIAIVAIALVGFLMLSGRMRFMRSLRLIVDCFMLLGSSTIAALLIGIGDEARRPARIAVDTKNAQPRETFPPSDDSTYSRASVRRYR